MARHLGGGATYQAGDLNGFDVALAAASGNMILLRFKAR